MLIQCILLYKNNDKDPQVFKFPEPPPKIEIPIYYESSYSDEAQTYTNNCIVFTRRFYISDNKKNIRAAIYLEED